MRITSASFHEDNSCILSWGYLLHPFMRITPASFHEDNLCILS